MMRSLLAAAFLAFNATLIAQPDTVIVRVAYAEMCDTTITLAHPKQLPAPTTTVPGHDGEQAAYTGALLWDVLGAACSSITEAPKRARLGMVVRI